MIKLGASPLYKGYLFDLFLLDCTILKLFCAAVRTSNRLTTIQDYIILKQQSTKSVGCCSLTTIQDYIILKLVVEPDGRSACLTTIQDYIILKRGSVCGRSVGRLTTIQDYIILKRPAGTPHRL